MLFCRLYAHMIIKLHHNFLYFVSFFLLVCFHNEVNVTVLRCLHDFGDEVYINYTVDRITDTPTPITIDVYQLGETKPRAFRCQNGSITDLVRIFFKNRCTDPVVVINRTATVNLSVEVEVKFSYMDMLCNTILIGPQRK